MSENFSPNNGSADAPKFTPAPPPQGAPVPPPMQGYQPKPSAALAITALVLGIFAFFTGLLFIGGALGASICNPWYHLLEKGKSWNRKRERYGNHRYYSWCTRNNCYYWYDNFRHVGCSRSAKLC